MTIGDLTIPVAFWFLLASPVFACGAPFLLVMTWQR
jgi:hypothetical protein